MGKRFLVPAELALFFYLFQMICIFVPINIYIKKGLLISELLVIFATFFNSY